MKRLFIAIDITPGKDLLDAFEKVRHTLRMERINWVRPEIMHLTLLFLGDTEEDVVDSLKNRLVAALSRAHPFQVSLRSLGVFRNIHDPRVIWIGCEAESELFEIKKELDMELRDFGFEAEDRPFNPHLTLGRIRLIRHQNHLAQLMGEFRDTVFQSCRINEVVLYESILKPEGPEYLPLKGIPLVT
jgi:2'-5' RNA ligase